MILDKYIDAQKTKNVVGAIENHENGVLRLSGITGSHSSCLMAAVHHHNQFPLLVVLPEKEEAAYFYNDLQQLISKEKVFFFPSSSHRMIKNEALKINALDRTLVLDKLSNNRFKDVIVTYPDALLEYCPNAQSVKNCKITKQNTQEAFSDVTLNKGLLNQLGPAMHSGRLQRIPRHWYRHCE